MQPLAWCHELYAQHAGQLKKDTAAAAHPADDELSSQQHGACLGQHLQDTAAAAAAKRSLHIWLGCTLQSCSAVPSCGAQEYGTSRLQPWTTHTSCVLPMTASLVSTPPEQPLLLHSTVWALCLRSHCTSLLPPTTGASNQIADQQH